MVCLQLLVIRDTELKKEQVPLSEVAPVVCLIKCNLEAKRFAIHHTFFFLNKVISQPAITCSKLTIETIEQGVKYVQS